MHGNFPFLVPDRALAVHKLVKFLDECLFVTSFQYRNLTERVDAAPERLARQPDGMLYLVGFNWSREEFLALVEYL